MDTQTAPVFTVQRAGERACFDHGWLQTCHSFSFADYHDPNNLNWGSLRVFNDDVVQPGQGFGEHPHRDMEIVTYVLAGELEHRDSMGHAGVVAPGGVQYMSAGTGVQHSEFNHSRERPVHFVQMWVLPPRTGVAPSYGQHNYTEEQRRNRWLAVASGQTSVESPVRLHADATVRVAKLEETALVSALGPDRYGFLFVAAGEVVANGERLRTADAVRMHNVTELRVEGRGELVLWDAPPVPRRVQGPA